METLITKIVCGIFWAIRQLFISSEIGALAHNYFLFLLDRFYPVRFGRKVPDVPEVSKLLRNGRWKSKMTIRFIRKNYELDPCVLNRLIENLIAWRSVIGYWRRRKWRKKGYVVPANILISPTYECNLNCLGCYAKGHTGELSLVEIKRIVSEQEDFGAFHVVVFGGEPFLRNDLWEVYADFPRTIFEVFTNGTLIESEHVAFLAELGNVRLLISLEGLRDTTDKRRGKGTYDRITETLNLCWRARIYFGISVTVAQENFEEVTSRQFIEEMNKFGIFVISYVLYMPFSDNDAFSSPTEEQVKKLELWGEYIRDHYPIYPMIGKNGSDSVTSCSAADGRIHITANGDVEPCVFCHYAADNTREKSILKAMRSEFFQRIRMFNNTGAACFTPCKVQKSIFLRNDFKEAGAYPTTRTTKGGK